MDKLIKALHLPSPIHRFSFEEFPDREILIKRDDLIHPQVSGNKWRKLKYNIQYAIDNGYEGVLSFGGAFSNHLYALAAACNLAGLKCNAYVRGDGFDSNNPTMKFLREQGAELTFLDRNTYRKKTQLDFIADIHEQWPNYYIVPEGGSNDLAVLGVGEVMEEVYDQTKEQEELLIFSGVGSGSTITGITKGLRPQDKAIGILAVNDSSLPAKIKNRLGEMEQNKLQLDLNSHLGGFGKTTPDLIKFINRFYTRTGIPLEPLYTAKVVYRLLAKLREDAIMESKTILVMHTGGLQGNYGFDYRFPGQLNNGLLI